MFHETSNGAVQSALILERSQPDAQPLCTQLRLACYHGHTLMSPIFYSGVEGFTRAQLTMLLFNTVALEIVVLAMQVLPLHRMSAAAFARARASVPQEFTRGCPRGSSHHRLTVPPSSTRS